MDSLHSEQPVRHAANVTSKILQVNRKEIEESRASQASSLETLCGSLLFVFFIFQNFKRKNTLKK